jgi:hypothetical protein
MRIWSIHPLYLDSKGLVALWREGLLALHVLSGKTKGYTNHPQLIRFKQQQDPIASITAYLHEVVNEAKKRNYHFDHEKLPSLHTIPQITVTSGQLEYETNHLKAKLEKRDPSRFLQFKDQKVFKPHPIFQVIDGDIEKWEKQSKSSLINEVKYKNE